MPSFMVKSAQQMSDFITPLTVTDAVIITDTVVKREINGEPGDGRGYFAVYGPGNDGTPGKWAMYVSPEHIHGAWWYHVILEEYHPRKDGKAEIEFGKPGRK